MKLKQPAHRKQAVDSWFKFVGERMNGSSAIKYEHRQRMSKICSFLYRQYQIDYRQYKVKHFRAILDAYSKKSGISTAQDYYRTIFQMIYLMDKENDWLPFLNGPWAYFVRREGLPEILIGERKPSKCLL